MAVFNFTSKANLQRNIFASPLDELNLIKKFISDNISDKIIFPKTSSFIKPIVSLARIMLLKLLNHLKKEKYAFAYKELSEKLGIKKIERIDAFI